MRTRSDHIKIILPIAIALMTSSLHPHGIQKGIEQFETALENSNFTQAQQLLKDLSPQLDPQTLAECVLHLAHGEWKIGAREQALALVDLYWSTLTTTRSACYAWMLKGRMLCATDDEQAWKCFQQAESLLELQSWPKEDQKDYADLSTRMQATFEQHLCAVQRLIDCRMYQEAVAGLEPLIDAIVDSRSAGYSLHTNQGICLLQKLILQKAQALINLGQPQRSLDSFERWPFANEGLSKTYELVQNQQMQKLFLEAKAYSLLGQPGQAALILEQCLEIGHHFNDDSYLLLQAQLLYAEQLHSLDKKQASLEALIGAQNTIALCPSEQIQEGMWRWTKQYTDLLVEMGMLHQALEELTTKLLSTTQPHAKAQLLFTQANLLEKLGEQTQAFEAYLQLLTLPAPSAQTLRAVEFILAQLHAMKQTPAGSHHIAEKMLTIFAKPMAASVDPKSKMLLCQWLIESDSLSKEQLNENLSPWLRAISTQQLKDQSLYLLAYIEQSPVQRSKYIDELKRDWPEANRWRQLALAFEEYTKPFSQRPHLRLAQMATVADEQIREQLYFWAFEKSLNDPSSSTHEWAQQFVQSNRLNQYQAPHWQLALAQLGLGNPHSESFLSHIQTLKSFSEHGGRLGLRSCLVLARHLACQGRENEADAMLKAWAQKHPLPDDLCRQCLIFNAEILYTLNPVASRSLISQILSRWANFEQRPWLQLRLYSLEEYQNQAAGSLENLHQTISRYGDHPASLSAYYLIALAKQKDSSVSQQLQYWEDIEKKASYLSKKSVPLEEEAISLIAQAGLYKAQCLEHMGMYKQACHTLSSLQNRAAAPFLQLPIHLSLEQQIRFELARMYLLNKDEASARQQLEKLIAEPTASVWSLRARLELAHLELSKGQATLALQLVKDLPTTEPDILRKRLLLSAKAWHQLQESTKSTSCLAQIIKTSQFNEELLQALWLTYEWNREYDPSTAFKALKNLAMHAEHPLGKKAIEIMNQKRS